MKFKKLLTILIVLCACLACEQQTGNMNPSAEAVPISFVTNLSMTRVAGSNWDNGDNVGIFMMKNESASYADNGQNKHYVAAANNSLSPVNEDNTLYWPLKNKKVDFIAYSPYAELSDLIYSMDITDQSNQSMLDFLYAEKIEGKSEEDGSVNFIFKHCLSKLVLNIIAETPIEESLPTANILGLPTKAEFDLYDGVLKNCAEVAQIAMHCSGTTLEATLLPGNVGDDVTVEILLDEELYTWQLNKSISELNPGYKYEYNVSLTAKEPVFVPAGFQSQIVDWTSQNDDVELSPVVPVIYSVGDYYPNPNVDITDATAVAAIEGLVYEVTSDGLHGKMISLVEGSSLKWNTTGAADYTENEDNGSENFKIIFEKEPALSSYPAFAWCESLGEGWYIPAINEVVALRTAWGLTNAEKDAFNAKLTAIGATPLSTSKYVEAKGSNQNAFYYSSTESLDARQKIWTVSFNGSSAPGTALKKSSDTQENLLFRAIKTF